MTQIKKVLYTAKTHTTGGRESGASRSSDGYLDIKLSTPGRARIGTNPEQLFARRSRKANKKYLNEYNIRNTNNWHVDDSGKDW
jgi:hypothetical protein